MPRPPASERQRIGRTPMTLEEALRIEHQAANGALDLSVDRTAEIVEEAHRVHLRAEIWGASGDERKRMHRLVGIGAASVLVFIGGLVACLAFTQ
ncbi:hypothetical protein GCM10022286_23620 [Gryllotalpicola daejeonensis]|uniref:DUF3618 domain-containing protein n=1 Tax=Gryllotalpicola daejeonensis TaxID=993087 RepID=A0ABP7ZLP5_9MICO